MTDGRFHREHEDIVCPRLRSKHDFTPIRKFNLMFKTAIGVTETALPPAICVPRPHRASLSTLPTSSAPPRRKLPFGVCQVGKAFRNRITSPSGPAGRADGVQFFCKPGTDLTGSLTGRDYCENWLLSLGIRRNTCACVTTSLQELAFYSYRAPPISVRLPFTDWGGWRGIADRTNYDLTRHQEASRQSLEYFDSGTNEHYIPYVIRPALWAATVWRWPSCASATTST